MTVSASVTDFRSSHDLAAAARSCSFGHGAMASARVASTAIFSIVNGVLLKPLAYRDAHRLVSVREVWKQFSDRFPMLEVNERHFEYWRQHARSFESLAQYI